MITSQPKNTEIYHRANDIFNKIRTLIVSTSKGYHFIDQNAILHLKSDKNYCNIFLTDGTRLFCSHTLKSIFENLDNSQFVRSHKSIVVNWKMIRHINHSVSEAKLVGGIIVPISRTRKKEVKSKLKE